MKTRSLVALLEVRSVERSVDFYARLGFEVLATFAPPSETDLRWASLTSEGAQLMLARAETERREEAPVLLYAYCDDVAAARESLAAQGVACGEIRRPFYAPRGEFEVRDPDGYRVVVSHT